MNRHEWIGWEKTWLYILYTRVKSSQIQWPLLRQWRMSDRVTCWYHILSNPKVAWGCFIYVDGHRKADTYKFARRSQNTNTDCIVQWPLAETKTYKKLQKKCHIKMGKNDQLCSLMPSFVAIKVTTVSVFSLFLSTLLHCLSPLKSQQMCLKKEE